MQPEVHTNACMVTNAHSYSAESEDERFEEKHISDRQNEPLIWCSLILLQLLTSQASNAPKESTKQAEKHATNRNWTHRFTQYSQYSLIKIFF